MVSQIFDQLVDRRTTNDEGFVVRGIIDQNVRRRVRLGESSREGNVQCSERERDEFYL